jgi:hypothetical protein
MTLSSDLKDATNAEPFQRAKAIWRGFLDGLGITITEKVKLVLDTIGPRIIKIPMTDEYIQTSRGVMMGEAIAKPTLTILNLAIEELAFFEYIGVDITEYGYDKPAPHRDWRAYHIAGDDHIAYGPSKYLDLIGSIHIKSGSMIDGTKHGKSKIMVKYTERILYTKNLIHKIKFKNIDKNLEKSIVIDGLKVRLLEKGQSTLLKKDDRNVAYGKALQLSRTLKWLKPTWWVKMSINLFIKRMGNLLPNKRRHPKIWFQLMLPQILGGLNLGIREDIYELANNCPYPTKGVINKICLGKDVTDELALLSKLNSNKTSRGSRAYKAIADLVLDRLRKKTFPMTNQYEIVTREDLWKNYPKARDHRERLNMARTDNIFGFSEFAQIQSRGTLFSELLFSDRVESEIFSTTPYAVRYRNIWDRLVELTQGYCDVVFTKESHPRLRGKIEYSNLDDYIKVKELDLSKLIKKLNLFKDVHESGLLTRHPRGLLVDRPY